jgi:biotin transport system substrate-specific component
MQNTLAVHFFERLSLARTRLLNVALVLGASLLIAASAQIVVRLPFSPVPITGQTFAVLLVGFVLGARLGAWSVALYLFEGAMGLPIFSGGGAGAGWLLGPTGGYLAGFLVAAFVVGYLAERGFDRKPATTLLTFAVGQVVIYLFGCVWLSTFVGWPEAFTAGVLPFLVGDAVKALLATAALPLAWRLVDRS